MSAQNEIGAGAASAAAMETGERAGLREALGQTILETRYDPAHARGELLPLASQDAGVREDIFREVDALLSGPLATLSAPNQPVPEEVRRASEKASKGPFRFESRGTYYSRGGTPGDVWAIEGDLVSLAVAPDTDHFGDGKAEDGRFLTLAANYVRDVISAQPTKPTGEDAGADWRLRDMAVCAADDAGMKIRRLEMNLRNVLDAEGYRKKTRTLHAQHDDFHEWARRELNAPLPATFAPAPIPADEVREEPGPTVIGFAINPEGGLDIWVDGVNRFVREDAFLEYRAWANQKIAALARPSAPGEGLRTLHKYQTAVLNVLRDTLTIEPDQEAPFPHYRIFNLPEAVLRIAALSRSDTAGEGRRLTATDLTRWLTDHAMLDPIPAEFAARALLERDDSPLRASPSPDTAGDGEGLERVRHVKRGTEYEVIGEAEAQICRRQGESDRFGDWRGLYEGNKLTVYRCLTTGKLWCRFTDEFDDGRFERLDRAAPSSQGEG